MFRGLNLTKKRNAQKINFSQPQSSKNLSIAVVRGLNLTKHCNAQKIPKLPTLKLTKHCNAQKFSKIQQILASMARPRPDSLKFWNALSTTGLREFQSWKKLIFFEHYSVSWPEPHKTL